ncbi:MAG: hypothetical protein LQ341_001693 [Variospora aurantia]|nr:MAG: hypothetical protein LQ341_001693 [Variospora aurantia]
MATKGRNAAAYKSGFLGMATSFSFPRYEAVVGNAAPMCRCCTSKIGHRDARFIDPRARDMDALLLYVTE